MLLTMSNDAGRADFDYPASGRFSTALAPAPLVLSQDLSNTIGIDHLPDLVDLLGQADTAQHWIDSVVPQWCASFGADDPHIVVTAAELPRLRAVRDALRSVIGEGAGPHGDAVITGTAAITVTGAGVHLEPVGSGASWLAGAIAVEAASARAQESFRRLKLCNEPRCRVAFYDRSKNQSRVWHDTATCGNQANSRAHRARVRLPPSRQWRKDVRREDPAEGIPRQLP
jgi:predicted RNA-binding Zn ribbon-like protein